MHKKSPNLGLFYYFDFLIALIPVSKINIAGNQNRINTKWNVFKTAKITANNNKLKTAETVKIIPPIFALNKHTMAPINATAKTPIFINGTSVNIDNFANPNDKKSQTVEKA